MMYSVGDTLIHHRHGTDHSWQDVYYITEICDDQLRLYEKGVKRSGWVIDRQRLDDDLAGEYPQFEIKPNIKPYSLDKELFTI